MVRLQQRIEEHLAHEETFQLLRVRVPARGVLALPAVLLRKGLYLPKERDGGRLKGGRVRLLAQHPRVTPRQHRPQFEHTHGHGSGLPTPDSVERLGLGDVGRAPASWATREPEHIDPPEQPEPSDVPYAPECSHSSARLYVVRVSVSLRSCDGATCSTLARARRVVREGSALPDSKRWYSTRLTPTARAHCAWVRPSASREAYRVYTGQPRGIASPPPGRPAGHQGPVSPPGRRPGPAHWCAAGRGAGAAAPPDLHRARPCWRGPSGSPRA